MLLSIQTIACRQPVIGNDANSLIIEELETRFSEEISVIQENVIELVLSIHRGPTDMEDDRPLHPKMARAVSASGLYASIVTFHAVKCWLCACDLTN